MKYCAEPGCPMLVHRGRCPRHERRVDQARGTAQERGYDSKWATYSQQYRLQHPVCGEQSDGTYTAKHGSRCIREGRTTPAQCVDHIIPLSQGGAMWDETNHQALCLACNSNKAKTLERPLGYSSTAY